jgi:UrcA family protein
MRDEIEARLWNQHHEAFSNHVAAGAGRAGTGLGRLNRAVPMPLKLMAAVLAVSVATLTAPSPALASQLVYAPGASTQVQVGDLDLGSATGRRTLQARIAGAARRICQPALIGSLKERADRQACYTAAIADADRQLQEAFAARGVEARPLRVAAR